jgi:hypothetical protein
MSQAKAIAALLFVLAIACVGWFVKNQADEIGTLKGTVTAQKETIAKQAKEVKLDKSGDAIDNKATNDAAKGVQVIHAQAQVTQDKTKTNEAAIRRKYEKLIAEAKASTPTPPEPVVPTEAAKLEREQAQAISANRLDGLWEEYCRDNVTCQPAPN